MTSKKNSKEVLTSAHSKSYVSQSGLAAILQSIREHGLPSSTSRSSIKRARDVALPQDLWLSVPMEMEDGSTRKITIVHPVLLLQHMASTIPAFATFMERKLVDHPNSAQSPWAVAVYSDEIIPGNMLKPRNDRKLVSFYWSFQEMDSAVGCEDLWHHSTAVRSTVVRSMKSGWSQLFRKVVESFFTAPLDLSKGVMLQLNGRQQLFFAKVGILVGDEPSIKGCWSCKGASGSLPCFMCRNVTLAASEIAQNDATGFFVPHTVVDFDMVRLHTDASVLRNAKSLQDKHAAGGTKASFARAEQALGLQYAPQGALWCDNVVKDFLHGGPISITHWDWMRVFFVSGVWNTEAGLLFQRIKDLVPVGDADRFFKQCVWPLQLEGRSATGKKALVKFVADGSEVKCSASEGLSLYNVLRLLIIAS